MADDVLLVVDEAMLAHEPGESHDERPERLRAILDELARAPVAGTRFARPQPAPRAALERVHAAAYLDQLEGLRGGRARLDRYTPVSPGTVDAAWLSAGAAMAAVAAVARGEARRSFSLGRPPGHHAEAARGMGYCVLGNAAIAAAHARAELGVERVLVADWDVHHGNGTQNAFYERDDVLFVDVHRHPFWPRTGMIGETGAGPGEGFTLNVPLPAGTGDGDYAAVLEAVLGPVAGRFAPGLLVVSAGYDAHRDDPAGGMLVTDEGFAALAGVARRVADAYAGGRLAFVLEGGYDVAALARSVRACTQVLAGAEPPPAAPATARAAAVVRRLREVHGARWGVGG